jgi:hypothetical protein
LRAFFAENRAISVVSASAFTHRFCRRSLPTRPKALRGALAPSRPPAFRFWAKRTPAPLIRAVRNRVLWVPPEGRATRGSPDGLKAVNRVAPWPSDSGRAS